MFAVPSLSTECGGPAPNRLEAEAFTHPLSLCKLGSANKRMDSLTYLWRKMRSFGRALWVDSGHLILADAVRPHSIARRISYGAALRTFDPVLKWSISPLAISSREPLLFGHRGQVGET